MIRMRNGIEQPSKIIVSAVEQKGVDIDAVEKFWVARRSAWTTSSSASS